ncbi:winged helix-turn-helix domain-containing protein [Paraburkholderia sp. BL25I1N1]|uniref:ATP-binding protein n=1 Tax=Paraburkholderia sp. BL25I1N1 TaxID=1938804 RepID=UPI000D070601|nr:winged helix-turn-helix domain-containing protein [Paraburkholderia sp. BL25I1N1]PRY04458.1 putative ATPase [Paraburkholderia sp. BL25I1N1]
MTRQYAFAFGPFRLDFPQRTLSRDGVEIKLGSRALDILVTIVEALGELVSTQTLVTKVWPNTIVDEGSLRVHMSILRKALDDGRDGARLIVNEMGRGYRLAVPVEKQVIAESVDRPAAQSTGRSGLPILVGRIVGRDAVIDGLSTSLSDRRLMTIAGAGGIGKTTVALGIGHRFEAMTSSKAYFVDFAPVTSPSRAASTIALAMGVPVSTDDPIPELVVAIGEQSILMVLDNCEHLVDTVTTLVERLLRGTSNLRLLITSREPLRAEGEWVHRLASLALPDKDSSLTVAEALEFAAVALFVERAVAAHDCFQLSEANVAAVRDICRQLDGIPLAIEMAAARIASMDAQTLAARLVDRFALLTRGRRNALPRQQTLRAMLDWSYALLEPSTQTVLNRLSLFRSAFDIDAAIAVANDPQIGDLVVVDAAADLVAKSLLVSDSERGSTTYRLLETTRHYAFDKLSEDNAVGCVQERHALYLCSLFVDPGPAWEGSAQRESTVMHSATIDDVRAAFDWAASPDGDPNLAVRIAAVTSPLWFQLSLPFEFMRLAERGIEAVQRAGLAGSIDHVQLLIAYGHAIWHTRGPIQAMADAFGEGLAQAKGIGDAEIDMRCMWGMWSQKLQSGQYAQSLEITRAYQRLGAASLQLSTTQTAKHTLALSLERLGQLDESLALIEDVLSVDGANPVRAGHANAAQMDGRIAAWTLEMRLLWLKGRSMPALALARKAVAESVEVGHDLSICFCLTMGALPVALWCGDREFGLEVLDILRSRTRQNGLRFWDTWADGFECIMNGVPLDVRSATIYQMEIFATLGDESSIAALSALRRSDEAIWCRAELLRREALRVCNVSEDVEARLAAAHEVAIAQGAHAWTLRIATTLAAVQRDKAEVAAARATLCTARRVFTEDDDSADVQEADALLRLFSS